VAEVEARRPLLDYIVAILDATRRHPLSEAGASPRGGLMLLAAARAHAALQGRDFVVPDDVQALAGAVLTHRIQTVGGIDAEAQRTVVEDALEEVPAR
jgi:MoxR-like ATPase